jgi:esterase/lipase
MSVNSENTAFAVGDQVLRGTLIAGKRPADRGILFIHGWGGTQEECLPQAMALAELGLLSLIFDLRGHGQDKDQMTVVSREDNLTDVLAAYDFVAARFELTDIGVVGNSYGGYLAAILTALRPVSHLGMQAPAIYRDVDWMLPKVKLHEDPDLAVYRSHIVGPDDNRALRSCAAYRGHVLIVESRYDAIIPHAVTQSYALACTQTQSVTFHVLQNADHALSEERWRDEYTSVLTNWIRATSF